MKFLSKGSFIKQFQPSMEDMSYESFLNNAKVAVKSNLYYLKSYKDLQKSELELYYKIFVSERDLYLSRFFETSLSKKKFHLSSERMMTKYSNNDKRNYKNIIRNLYYKEILELTTSGFENTPSFLHVIRNAFKFWIIDYKLVTPSALFYIKNGKLGSVFSGFYFRASILNPFLVYQLNETLLHGTKIFTPTLGWSSYLYGFLESKNVQEYVGVDVIPKVCKTTSDFAQTYYPNKNVEIHCTPSEDLSKDTQFRNKYKSFFDVVFFSPPYFKLELYPGNIQSTKRYDSYNHWLDKYFTPTIELCSHVLENKGKLCFIVSGYGTSKDYVDLIKDMKSITEKFVKFSTEIPLHNTNVSITKHRSYSESILLFYK